MSGTHEEHQAALASDDAAPVRGIRVRDARELAKAQADAEVRLGRALTEGEKRIDIIGIDRDLKNGKQRLHDAIKAEQSRAVAAYAEKREPIQLKVTDEMIAALADLYDAGVQHATSELEAAGIIGGA